MTEIDLRKAENIGRYIDGAGIAHDIRTMLLSINLATEVINREKARLSPLAAENLSIIFRSAAAINDMIEAMLGDDSQGSPNREEIRIQEWIVQFGKMVAPIVRTSKQTLNLRFPKQDVDFLADRRLLERAVFNLVYNASKYSPPNTAIDLKVYAKNNRISISVHDKGSGISRDDIDRIFRPFVRSDEETHGFGLGLSIVRKIVESHGGNVSVESEIGQGSTFTITLPHLRKNRKQHRILICDDNRSNAESLCYLLQLEGFRPSFTTSVEDCIAGAKLQHWDAILMDLDFDGSDRGTEAARILKEEKFPGKIIAFTGSNREDISKDFDLFLQKPASVSELIGFISRV